jgi:hypothetical protein
MRAAENMRIADKGRDVNVTLAAHGLPFTPLFQNSQPACQCMLLFLFQARQVLLLIAFLDFFLSAQLAPSS